MNLEDQVANGIIKAKIKMIVIKLIVIAAIMGFIWIMTGCSMPTYVNYPRNHKPEGYHPAYACMCYPCENEECVNSSPCECESIYKGDMK